MRSDWRYLGLYIATLRLHLQEVYETVHPIVHGFQVLLVVQVYVFHHVLL